MKRIIKLMALLGVIAVIFCACKAETGIKVPKAAKKLKGKNYHDVVQMFEEAGFTNIETVPHEDLLEGQADNDGRTESIAIDGEKRFDAEARFESDALVVIVYHTFAESEDNGAFYDGISPVVTVSDNDLSVEDRRVVIDAEDDNEYEPVVRVDDEDGEETDNRNVTIQSDDNSDSRDTEMNGILADTSTNQTYTVDNSSEVQQLFANDYPGIDDLSIFADMYEGKQIGFDATLMDKTDAGNSEVNLVVCYGDRSVSDKVFPGPEFKVLNVSLNSFSEINNIIPGDKIRIVVKLLPYEEGYYSYNANLVSIEKR
ncbi:MAG: DUF4839 domain-containing protein [Lachnospiraceae bacterium]|nr:DUF4839 domain-containing protein [Lachnospiraceae bacterium]